MSPSPTDQLIKSSQTSSRTLSALLTRISALSTRPSTLATNSEVASTRPSYHLRTKTSLRARSSAISAACARCVTSTPRIRGSSAASDALSAGSGTGVSATAVVRADAAAGNEGAAASTMARIASGGRCVVGGSLGGSGWKRSGWDLSIW